MLEDTAYMAYNQKKKYRYIPELQGRIVKNRLTSGAGIIEGGGLDQMTPEALVWCPVPAPATSESVQRQLRRGLGKLHIYCLYCTILPITEWYEHYNILRNFMFGTVFNRQHLMWKGQHRRAPGMFPCVLFCFPRPDVFCQSCLCRQPWERDTFCGIVLPSLF